MTPRLPDPTYSSAETLGPERPPSEGLSYDLTTIRLWRAIEGLQTDQRWQRAAWATLALGLGGSLALHVGELAVIGVLLWR